MNDDTHCPNDETLFPQQRLDAYRVSLAMTERVFAAKIGNADLRDQAQRASSAVFLALNEGLPNDRPAMRRTYFERARNSLFELVGCVDLASRTGAMRREDARAVHELALRVRAMLVALLRAVR